MITPKQIAIAGAGVFVIAIATQIPKTSTTLRRKAEPPAYKVDGGYLPAEVLREGQKILDPPPAPMSAAMKQDEEAREAALKLRTGARYRQAVLDSKRGSASTLEAFSCAFGMDINASRTPRLFKMLERVNIDLRRAAYPIKNLYKRQRPYVVYHTQTCSPDDEALVKREGSYPSGRSAVGRGFALILAEVNPVRADSIMERGHDFGQSRVICDAQWQSDVDAGNELGTMVVARLHSNSTFQADLAAAKQEVARALRAGAKPPAECEGPAAIASR